MSNIGDYIMFLYQQERRSISMKKLAEKYHAGQFRKGADKQPYIVHPQAVAKMLIRWGKAPDSAAVQSAWGHDLLEDTAVSENEIAAVGGETVLNNIRMLSCPPQLTKAEYLKRLAEYGSGDLLLVKVADRICNSKDFVKLKGTLYAYQYLHEADCLPTALEKFSDDTTVKNALQEWEMLDEQLRNEAKRAAIRGCMLGGAVGDALGAPIEFMKISDIQKAYGSSGVTDYVEFPDGTGAITDDTQMALFTAEGIMRAFVRGCEKGICNPTSVVWYSYLRWLETQGYSPDIAREIIYSGWLINEKRLFSCRAPGMTCLSALEPKRHPAVNNSKGCGTVMRIAPAGLFYPTEYAYKNGCEFSAITHRHPTGITAGGALAMLVAYLLDGKPLNTALDLTEKYLLDIPEAAETLAAIRQARCAETITELGEGWVAEETLAISIFCALKHTWDFRAGVLEAVNINGDSDSTGAVTGNILGILNGENAIPGSWRTRLREYDIVSQVADDLADIAPESDGHFSSYWWDKYPGF